MACTLYLRCTSILPALATSPSNRCNPNPKYPPDPLYWLSTASTACATPSTCASVPRIPATVKPTGASPGVWHGSEAAQPSRALIWW